ncbi:MAG: hypothetical protein KKB25_00975, partial [Nanoarchaeota archaeon]|nr:hypothetical protein [Nanoarchaeota archaeon]
IIGSVEIPNYVMRTKILQIFGMPKNLSDFLCIFGVPKNRRFFVQIAMRKRRYCGQNRRNGRSDFGSSIHTAAGFPRSIDY